MIPVPSPGLIFPECLTFDQGYSKGNFGEALSVMGVSCLYIHQMVGQKSMVVFLILLNIWKLSQVI